MRADLKRNRDRILVAGRRLLDESPTTSLTEIAAAAGVARSTLHRHFPDREALVKAIEETRGSSPLEASSGGAGAPTAIREGRANDVAHPFDAVAPALLPGQLVAEAQRVAGVPVALYVVDLDGSRLLRLAGPGRLPEEIDAPLAIGPELDADGLAELRGTLRDRPGVSVVPLWLRGRAIGAMLTLGKPRASLSEVARQAALAVALADRYTDTFARGKRRKQPRAAAEIQQSLLPPRIVRISGGEVAGNVLPSYEVAGDWFDVVENPDAVWIAVANGLGENIRAAASSAVARGALRASRRGGGTIANALMLVHRTLKGMPGPGVEMRMIVAHWDPASLCLRFVNCGHLPPIVIRRDGRSETLGATGGKGLGGRSAPKLSERTASLGPRDRLVICSDGVIRDGEGRAGLGFEDTVTAALLSEAGSAADTVRRIHAAVLERCGDDLEDDATVVCLAVE